MVVKAETEELAPQGYEARKYEAVNLEPRSAVDEAERIVSEHQQLAKPDVSRWDLELMIGHPVLIEGREQVGRVVILTYTPINRCDPEIAYCTIKAVNKLFWEFQRVRTLNLAEDALRYRLRQVRLKAIYVMHQQGLTSDKVAHWRAWSGEIIKRIDNHGNLQPMWSVWIRRLMGISAAMWLWTHYERLASPRR